MILKMIESADEFFSMRDEWNALLNDSVSDCVFLTHEWLSTWWKHLRERRGLAIITARENGKLIGAMPLAIRAPQYTRMMPRVAEFIGSGQIGSDYLDLIIQQGQEQPVCRAFAAELRRWGLMVQMSQLRREGCLAADLQKVLVSDRWRSLETIINVCPFIDLRNHTWESYLATLGSSQRYNFNRKLRNAQKTFELRLEKICAPNDSERGLDAVMSLHHKRWDPAGISEAFQTREVIAFHREFVRLAAERGWLRLFALFLDNEPVAALYGLRYGATFYFYQSGFDPAYSRHSVGLVMMGLAIKSAIEEEAYEYDLLHGDEEYKFHWAMHKRDLSRLELYPPDARSRIYRRALGLNRAARRMARRVLNKV